MVNDSGAGQTFLMSIIEISIRVNFNFFLCRSVRVGIFIFFSPEFFVVPLLYLLLF